MTLGPPLPMPPDDMWDEDSDEAIWGFSASMFHVRPMPSLSVPVLL